MKNWKMETGKRNDVRDSNKSSGSTQRRREFDTGRPGSSGSSGDQVTGNGKGKGVDATPGHKTRSTEEILAEIVQNEDSSAIVRKAAKFLLEKAAGSGSTASDQAARPERTDRQHRRSKSADFPGSSIANDQNRDKDFTPGQGLTPKESQSLGGRPNPHNHSRSESFDASMLSRTDGTDDNKNNNGDKNSKRVSFSDSSLRNIREILDEASLQNFKTEWKSVQHAITKLGRHLKEIEALDSNIKLKVKEIDDICNLIYQDDRPEKLEDMICDFVHQKQIYEQKYNRQVDPLRQVEVSESIKKVYMDFGSRLDKIHSRFQDIASDLLKDIKSSLGERAEDALSKNTIIEGWLMDQSMQEDPEIKYAQSANREMDELVNASVAEMRRSEESLREFDRSQAEHQKQWEEHQQQWEKLQNDAESAIESYNRIVTSRSSATDRSAMIRRQSAPADQSTSATDRPAMARRRQSAPEQPRWQI